MILDESWNIGDNIVGNILLERFACLAKAILFHSILPVQKMNIFLTEPDI